MPKLGQWLGRARNQTFLALVVTCLSAVVAAGWNLYVHFNTPKTPIVALESCTKPPQPLNSEIENAIILRALLVKTAFTENRDGRKSITDAAKILYQKFPSNSQVTLQVFFIYYACVAIYRAPDLSRSDKSEAVNTITTTIISENNFERIQAEKSDDGVTQVQIPTLNGKWTGRYFYNEKSAKNRKEQSVPFNIELVDDNAKIYGIISEPRTFSYASTTTAKRLLSFIIGERSGQGIVRFRKSYIGMAGASHSIRYEGIWNGPSGSISGKWLSPNDPEWWGRFVMFKKSDDQ